MAGGGVLAEFFIALGLDVNASSFAAGQIAVDLLKKGIRLLSDAVRSVPDLAERAASYANDITDMSEATGIGVEKIQELAFAAKSADVDMHEMGMALGNLAQQAVAASRGTKESVAEFHR